MGPNIKIRSDLNSCEHIPAAKVNVKLPDPLAHLIGTLPSVGEMPTYNRQVDASMDMLRNVREKLTRVTSTANIETLQDIAKRIATEMKTLKPSLARHFDNLDSLRQSITISLSSFLLSMILHVLFFWAYHRYSGVRRLVPQFLKGEDQKTKIPMKPVMCMDTSGHANVKLDTDNQKLVFDEITLRIILAMAKNEEERFKGNATPAVTRVPSLASVQTINLGQTTAEQYIEQNV